MPVLYLNGQETEAHIKNDGLEVLRFDYENDDMRTMRVQLFDLSHVVLIGWPKMTTPVWMKLADKGIPVHLVSRTGRWRGSMHPNKNGHALRRLRQYELARDSSFGLRVAAKLVTAKIRNCRRVLQRLAANRKASETPEQIDISNTLMYVHNKVKNASTVDELRGCEGLAAATYFRRLTYFFPEKIPFRGRSRRPPGDAANALLSWTYSIVLTEVDTAVRVAGLDPCLGFLHGIDYGRSSLSLDLLEPLRAPLCDLLVLNILNHGVLQLNDFEHQDGGGVYLKTNSRKRFFREYERLMQRRFAPRQGESHTDFRQVLRTQVHTLLRAMEGKDLENFFQMP